MAANDNPGTENLSRTDADHLRPATPTPQAQAGDAVTLPALPKARQLAYYAGTDPMRYYTEGDMLSFAKATLNAAIRPQAPARDAGAVAWQARFNDGEWFDIAEHEIAAHESESGWQVRPLYTHPAAASDDARRLLRECRDYVHNAAVDEAEMNAHRRTQKHGDRDLLARIDAALSSPDGLRKGEAT